MSVAARCFRRTREDRRTDLRRSLRRDGVFVLYDEVRRVGVIFGYGVDNNGS